MIQRLLTNLFPVVAFLLLVSCSRDDDCAGTGTQQVGSSQKIRFEMVYASATAVPSGDAARTRVSTSTDGNYTSVWTNGDKVGLYIVKGSGNLLSSGNWVDNLEMTYDNGAWSYTMPVGKEYYPIGETLDFYAYYPYQASINPLNVSFSVKIDQGTIAGFEKSDLLMAKNMSISNSANPVQLTFSHAMALVELSVSNGMLMSDQVTVTLEKCMNNAVGNLATGSCNSYGAGTSIKMYRVEQSTDANYHTSYTYRALVPKQTFSGRSWEELFKFEQGSYVLEHRPNKEVSLGAGQVFTFNITLLDPDHVYKVGDVYPYKWKPMGVVFEITDGGKHGKVVNFVDSPEKVKWGARYLTNANSTSDGEENMRKIQGLSGYPAFEYCANLGAGWYLPAYDELVTIFNASLNNAAFTSYGGSAMESPSYLSSTEHSYEYAWYVCPNKDMNIFEKIKTEHYARAVRKF